MFIIWASINLEMMWRNGHSPWDIKKIQISPRTTINVIKLAISKRDNLARNLKVPLKYIWFTDSHKKYFGHTCKTSITSYHKAGTTDFSIIKET